MSVTCNVLSGLLSMILKVEQLNKGSIHGQKGRAWEGTGGLQIVHGFIQAALRPASVLRL